MPFPTFSDDDVEQFLIHEAVMERWSEEQERQRELDAAEAEKNQLRADAQAEARRLLDEAKNR